MTKPVMFLIGIGVAAGFSFSQTVNICGRVLDQNGKPLTHTLVRLGQTRTDNGYGPAPYYTVTDKNGQYHLGSGVCTITNIAQSNTKGGKAFCSPQYLGGKVLFSIPRLRETITLRLFDLNGRLARDIMDKSLSQGDYSVAIGGKEISSQYYLLRVTIGGASYVMKMLPLSRVSGGSIVLASSDMHVSLEKLAAVVDTIRATEPGYTLGVTPVQVLSGQIDFTLTKNNMWNGDTAAFWDTTNVKKQAGHIWYTILNRTNGMVADSLIYYAIGDNGVPQRLSSGNTIDVTTNASSGRIYIMVGYKPSAGAAGGYRPSNQVWDFEEHTNGLLNSSLWFHGNTTRVDAFGTPIAYRLHCTDGFDTARGEQYYMFYQPRQSIFDEFTNEVPYEFTALGTMLAPSRIPNPGTSGSPLATGGKYATYWNKYINSFGISATSYLNGIDDPKTSAACHRHVLGMTDAQQADSTNHYKAAPCNFYSYFLHRRALDYKCYGFPYDDVSNWSSYMEHSNVSWVEIAVGY